MRCKKWGQSNEDGFFSPKCQLRILVTCGCALVLMTVFFSHFTMRIQLIAKESEIMTYQRGRGSNPLLSKFLEISGV